MKVRLLAGSLLAVPAMLVAMATNGHAGSTQGAAAFAGRITITPSIGGTGTANICFDASLSCADSVGAAGGAVVAEPVIGMVGSLAYNEKCTAAVPYAPTGLADLSVSFKRDEIPTLQATTTPPVTVKWQRFGLIAVITGTGDYLAAGAAVVAPAPHLVTVPACGSPLDLVVTGAMAFA